VTFEAAVRATPEICNGYCPGLRALKGEHRSKMTRKNTQCSWRGSVDIDAGLAARYPNDARWDYAIGFGYQSKQDGVAFVEVHHASSSEVETVIRKKDWLTGWVTRSAPSLRGMAPGGFHWVSSDGVHIPQGSRQRRRLALSGITVGSVARIG